MASSASSSTRSQRYTLILLVAWITIASSVAAGRPCKTLWVSSYAFSLRQQPASSGSVTVLTEISHFRPLLTSDAAFFIDLGDRDELPRFQLQQHHQRQEQEQQRQLPRNPPLFPSFSSAAADLSSLRDRTKDILSVVVALLFGVGCGALTAATMYLAWSLFSARNDYSDEDFAAEDAADDVNPKKMGYVKIPAAASKETTV